MVEIKDTHNKLIIRESEKTLKLQTATGVSSVVTDLGGLQNVDTTGKVTDSVIKYNAGTATWEIGVDNNTTYSASDFNHDDLSNIPTNDHIDWTSDQGATNINDANINESAVTQHESAISITEDQISNLNHYDSTDFDSDFSGKSTDNLTEGSTNLYWDYDADNNAIVNVSDPSNAQDAATKNYVDGKEHPVTGTAQGQMQFWDGSNWTYTETTEVSWDDINKRMGLGTSSPDQKFHCVGNAKVESGDLSVQQDQKIYLDGQDGNTYFNYNSSTGRLELWVGGVKQNEWG